MISTTSIKKLVLITIFLIPLFGFAQLSPFWGTEGNNASNGNFLGTTNNEPLIFKTNSLEALRIKTNGEIKISAFENIGKGVVTFNNNGVLTTRLFPNDTNQVFCGSGNFKSVSALTGWTRTGNVLFNSTGVNVGIGTNSPQYALDVVGSANFTGTISAQGVILTNKLLADTMKADQMLSLNNNMHLIGGGINEVYTSSGNLRIQSNANVTASHVIVAAGTNGYVGIGTFNPAYKLDVTGNLRVTESIVAQRLKPLPGDTVIAFGDSTIYMSINNRMWPGAFGTIKGMSIGNFTSTGNGLYSLAIGSKVVTTATADYAIAMGSGVIGGSGALINSIPSSMMIGFNSNRPTVFVGPASGPGTVGKVGIGTSIPEADFQVGESFMKVCMGGSPAVASTFSTNYIGLNVARRGQNDWITGHDGANNGGTVLMSDVDGGLRIVVVRSTGASNQPLTDQDIESKTRLFIRGDGRVIIGDQTQVGGAFDLSNTLLTVNGNVVCRKVHVTVSSWADSVLAPTFTLMPLDSVSTYIKSNGHLPGVPSEQEVKAKGTDLAQTDRILLAKVEELTLYMIQLQEQNVKLQKRIEELENNEDDN